VIRLCRIHNDKSNQSLFPVLRIFSIAHLKIKSLSLKRSQVFLQFFMSIGQVLSSCYSFSGMKIALAIAFIDKTIHRAADDGWHLS